MVPQQVFAIELAEKRDPGHPYNTLAMVVPQSGAVLLEASSGRQVDIATACGLDSSADLRVGSDVIRVQRGACNLVNDRSHRWWIRFI